MKLFFVKELFYTTTAALALFAIFELAHPGLVLAYLNLNWLLIFWLIIGIIVVVFDKADSLNKQEK